MKKFVNRLLYPNRPPRQQLEDWTTAWILLNCVNHFRFPEEHEKLEQHHIDKYTEDAKKLEKDEVLGERVQKMLEQQVISMFQGLKDFEMSNELALPTTRISTPSSSFSMALGSKTMAPVNAAQSAPQQHPLADSVKQPLSDFIGFELETKESTIPGARKGVFVKHGDILPGTVLGFYPGKVHLFEFVKKREYTKTLLPDPDLMLMTRFDGIIIDGRAAGEVNWNPFAIGHKINHCPPGAEPNVLNLPFKFERDPIVASNNFPEELRKYVPNKYAKEPTIFGSADKSYFMQSVVVMNKMRIRPGQELFLDYRINPLNPNKPAWFTVVDEACEQQMYGEESDLKFRRE